MKKNTLRRVVAGLALSAVAVSATSLTAFADFAVGPILDEVNITDEQMEASPSKPILSVSKETLTVAEAKANPTRKVTLSVTGIAADHGFAATGMHVTFDSSLSVTTAPNGKPEVEEGPAIKYLDQKSYKLNADSVFIATGGSGNYGTNGDIFTFEVTIPQDKIVDGAVFPFNVEYVRQNSTADLFSNVKKDLEGNVMTAYAFSHADNGYIEIIPDETTSSTTSTTSTTTTTTTTTVTSTDTSSESTSTSSTSTSSTTSTEPTSSSSGAGSSTSSTTSTTKTTAANNNSPKTGVAGVGVAAAGLAIAVGTAFVLRKKED